MSPRLFRYPDGITAVDTLYVRENQAASHVIVHGGRAAFVDTGSFFSVPQLLAALDVLGVARAAVDWVFLTHVHLDHAGGAGALMRELPNARAVLHPRGAPHMIDPTKLIAASIEVYGEARYRKLYGDIVPIPAERIVTTEDGQRLALAGREFEFLHTPGHAMHHHSIADHGSRSLFTGDTFGVSYRELDGPKGAFVLPTTTPNQFDPAQLDASIARLLAQFAPEGPRALYLTHFGRVTDVARLGALLRLQVAEYARLGEQLAHAADRREKLLHGIRQFGHGHAGAHRPDLSDAQIEALLGEDYQLNADGLEAWLSRARRSRS